MRNPDRAEDGGLVWVDLGAHGVVRAVGPDAVRFVDNFVTASLASRSVGEGTEAFVADAKGWVMALVEALRVDDGVLLHADAAPLGERLAQHLERYHIREQLEIVDASGEFATMVVAGEGSGRALEQLIGSAVPQARLGHREAAIAGATVRVVRVDWLAAEAYLLLVPGRAREAVAAVVSEAGFVRASRGWFDARRIEQGMPASVDIPERTLPQELGRDARAISFTKGCYLGQETVARIDALGHVNRKLTGLVVEGAVPSVGADVRYAGEIVGAVTSACFSPALGRPLVMAIVHGKATEAAAIESPKPLTIEGRSATIVPLPIDRDGTPPAAAETLLVAKRFRVVATEESLADGTTRTREVVEHPGSVVILPVLEDADGRAKLVLVENHRVAIGRPLLELPAGTLDRDEPIVEAARRELAEETGYRAGRLTSLGGFWMSPGILRERMHLFEASALEAGPQALEPGERIVVRVVDREEAVAMCLDGRIDDAKSVAGILLADAARRRR